MSDRLEPIGRLPGSTSEGRIPPVAPIGRRPREEHQEPPPRRPRRHDDGQEHLLDEEA